MGEPHRQGSGPLQEGPLHRHQTCARCRQPCGAGTCTILGDMFVL